MLSKGPEIAVFDFELNTQELFLLGDIHVDAATFRREEFEKAAKIMEGIPKVILGDVNDYGFFDDLLNQLRKEGYKREEATEEAEIRAMLAVDEVLDRLDKTLLVCEGNHDIRVARKTGQNFLHYTCKKRGIEYFKGQAILRLSVGKKANGRSRTYRFLLTHGSRGGRRQSAALNELEDLARTVSGIDLVAIGHHHRFILSEITKTTAYFSNIYTETTFVISVPSFLGFEEYSQKRGYPPPKAGIVKIVFTPRTGALSVQYVSL